MATGHRLLSLALDGFVLFGMKEDARCHFYIIIVADIISSYFIAEKNMYNIVTAL